MNIDFKTLLKDIKTADGGTYGNHKRFIVSVTNNITDAENLSLFELEKTIDNFKAIAKEKGLLNWCVGFWSDKETGLIYLDLNISTDRKHTARTTAVLNNQLAIWDSRNQKELRV